MAKQTRIRLIRYLQYVLVAFLFDNYDAFLYPLSPISFAVFLQSLHTTNAVYQSWHNQHVGAKGRQYDWRLGQWTYRVLPTPKSFLHQHPRGSHRQRPTNSSFTSKPCGAVLHAMPKVGEVLPRDRRSWDHPHGARVTVQDFFDPLEVRCFLINLGDLRVEEG